MPQNRCRNQPGPRPAVPGLASRAHLARGRLAPGLSSRGLAAACALLASLLLAPAALGQSNESPVFLEDSPQAQTLLLQLDSIIDSGATGEAVRTIQRLLEEQGERVVQHPGDPRLHTPVRDRLHEALLERPELLDRYRRAEGPLAETMLEAGEHAEVERSRFLTTAGLEATLRLAQLALEDARFEHAWALSSSLLVHPDLARGAGDAFEIARSAAVHLDGWQGRERAHTSYRALAEAAGIGSAPSMPGDPEAVRRAAAPDGADVFVATGSGIAPGQNGGQNEVSTAQSDGVDLSSVVPNALARTRVLAESPIRSTNRRTANIRPGSWIIPVSDGRAVYINDGRSVRALDVFSLAELWRARPDPPPDTESIADLTDENRVRLLEDPTVVSVWQDRVFAATGAVSSGSRVGDPRLHAIDRMTGEILWSVDPQDADPQLAGASVRGPVAASEGVVVVSLRKTVTARRSTGAYLLGLDARTGEPLWWRLVASAGVLPYPRGQSHARGLALEHGVVYLADDVGAVGAYDAQTGRPRWVRTESRESVISQNRLPTWELCHPVIWGHIVYAISPENERVIAYDKRSGAMLAQRAAGAFGSPFYLALAGDHLALIGHASVTFVHAQSLLGGEMTQAPTPPAPGFLGRGAVNGGNLCMPVAGEVWIINPERAGEPTAIALDEPGNLAVLPGELLTAQGGMLHAFLSWETASRLLGERLRRSPDDAGAAVAFVELALGAGRDTEIIPSADRAIEIIERTEETASGGLARERLFSALRATTRSRVAEGIDDVTPGLVTRLERLERTPSERVERILLDERQRELTGDLAGAADACQEIVESAELSGVTWRGPSVTIRADLEATRRLANLVREHGLGVYSVHDERAEALAREQVVEVVSGEPVGGAEGDAQGNTQGDPGALEALAARFPVARSGPRVLLRAAQLRSASGEAVEAARNARAGLDAAARVMAAEEDRAAPDEVLGEGVVRDLLRLRIESFASRGDLLEARRLVEATVDRFGADAALGRTGASAEELLGSVLGAALSTRRHARIAPVVSRSGIHLIAGARLTAAAREPGAPTDGAFLLDPIAGDLIWARSDAQGVVEEVWRSPAPVPAVPVVLALGRERAIVFWPPVEGALDNSRDGGVVVAFDLKTGASAWVSEPFDRLVGAWPEPATRGRRARFTIYGSGVVNMRDVLAVSSDRCVVLTDRSGRAAAIDQRSGKVLWTRRLDVTEVADLAATGGLLAVAGRRLTQIDEDDEEDRFESLDLIDLATGRVRRRVEPPQGGIAWVRASGGRFVAGGVHGITAVDAFTEGEQWSIGDEDIRAARDAWLEGDRLVLVDDVGTLTTIDAQSGRVGTRTTISELRSDVELRLRIGRGLVVSSPGGLWIIDDAGEVVARDGVAGRTGLAWFGEHHAAAVAAGTFEPGAVGAAKPTLTIFDLTSAMLTDEVVIDLPAELVLEARGVSLIDNAVLIDFGSATLVVPAPATETDDAANEMPAQH